MFLKFLCQNMSVQGVPFKSIHFHPYDGMQDLLHFNYKLISKDIDIVHFMQSCHIFDYTLKNMIFMEKLL